MQSVVVLVSIALLSDHRPGGFYRALPRGHLRMGHTETSRGVSAFHAVDASTTPLNMPRAYELGAVVPASEVSTVQQETHLRHSLASIDEMDAEAAALQADILLSASPGSPMSEDSVVPESEKETFATTESSGTSSPQHATGSRRHDRTSADTALARRILGVRHRLREEKVETWEALVAHLEQGVNHRRGKAAHTHQRDGHEGHASSTAELGLSHRHRFAVMESPVDWKQSRVAYADRAHDAVRVHVAFVTATEKDTAAKQQQGTGRTSSSPAPSTSISSSAPTAVPNDGSEKGPRHRPAEDTERRSHARRLADEVARAMGDQPLLAKTAAATVEQVTARRFDSADDSSTTSGGRVEGTLLVSLSASFRRFQHFESLVFNSRALRDVWNQGYGHVLYMPDPRVAEAAALEAALVAAIRLDGTAPPSSRPHDGGGSDDEHYQPPAIHVVTEVRRGASCTAMLHLVRHGTTTHEQAQARIRDVNATDENPASNLTTTAPGTSERTPTSSPPDDAGTTTLPHRSENASSSDLNASVALIVSMAKRRQMRVTFDLTCTGYIPHIDGGAVLASVRGETSMVSAGEEETDAADSHSRALPAAADALLKTVDDFVAAARRGDLRMGAPTAVSLRRVSAVDVALLQKQQQAASSR